MRKEILALPKSSWVFIDEIQKLPILLDEVHSILEEFKGHYHFILTGSSARKLKRDGANLLAGRAITQYLYPLTFSELKNDFSVEKSLKFGNLPIVVTEKTNQAKIDFLQTYVDTYLKEEIQQEAAVKNLSSFVRFLKVATISNGQKLNLSGLSRNAGVERSTAQGYFQILTDTLIGELLQPWSLKFRVKEVDHPKFYFFDTGVVRTLLNLLHDDIESADKGFLLETLLFHELKAYNSYHKIGGEFYFWGAGNLEVDFIYSRGKTAVGIEVKSSKQWKKEFSTSLKLLLEAKKIKYAYGVYLGEAILNDEGVMIFPLSVFLKRLNNNELNLFS